MVSNQIKNFYEVCNQAEKSVHWKHKLDKEFFNHLLRRKTKSKKAYLVLDLKKETEMI